MKKLLICSVLLLLASVGICQEKLGFVINGEMRGVTDGGIVLIANGFRDTLATGDLVNGKFRLTGSVDSVCLAHVMIEGFRTNGYPFLLENSEEEFQLFIDHTRRVGSWATGGYNQNIAREFYKKSEICQLEMLKWREELKRAEIVNDTRAYDRAMAECLAIQKKVVFYEDSLLTIYGNTYAGAFAVYSIGAGNIDKLKEKSRYLGEKAWNTEFGRKIKEKLRAAAGIEIGLLAPNFMAETRKKQEISLYSVKGKLKLLVFWASWCGPCRQEIPRLRELYKEFHRRGLEMVSFSVDDSKADWLQAVKDEKMPWIQLRGVDGKPSIADAYLVTAIPATFLLDAENRIVAMNLRGTALTNKIDELLMD